MPSILKTLAKLLTEFKCSNNVTPVDLVDTAIKKDCITQNEGKHFLQLAKHEKFLENVAEEFIDCHKLRRISKINVEVLLYFVIFVLDQANYHILLNVEMFYVPKLLVYLLNEDHHLLLTKIACRIFENNYVLESLLYPLLDKLELLYILLTHIEESNRVIKKNITIPKEFQCFNKFYKKTPAPPMNTPENRSVRTHKTAKPAKCFQSISRKLVNHYEKNRVRAAQLLEEANKVPKHLTEPKKELKELPPIAPKNFKANKPPPKKEIEIKGNLTTTLREASRLIKEQENEIKKIEEIIKGGANIAAVEQMEVELRQERQQKEMEDIERKHLQSLLTHEEAILAKQKLLELNKQKSEGVRESKIELLEKLEKWKEEEQEKIRAVVEKCHKTRRDLKESEKKLQEERQNQVRIQQYETRELLKKAYEEQRKELARKMQLIQEIRTLHEIRCNMNVKEFDPTECTELGLLCQMSLAELQERLAIVKIQMKEELEEKRRRVLKRKEQQQEMLDNVRNFIAQTRRMSKPKLVPISTVNLERSPDLNELRRQLEEKRSLRMKATRCT